MTTLYRQTNFLFNIFQNEIYVQSCNIKKLLSTTFSQMIPLYKEILDNRLVVDVQLDLQNIYQNIHQYYNH